jgi:hypothetical protein
MQPDALGALLGSLGGLRALEVAQLAQLQEVHMDAIGRWAGGLLLGTGAPPGGGGCCRLRSWPCSCCRGCTWTRSAGGRAAVRQEGSKGAGARGRGCNGEAIARPITQCPHIVCPSFAQPLPTQHSTSTPLAPHPAPHPCPSDRRLHQLTSLSVRAIGSPISHHSMVALSRLTRLKLLRWQVRTAGSLPTSHPSTSLARLLPGSLHEQQALQSARALRPQGDMLPALVAV